MMAYSLRERLLAWVMLPLVGAVAIDAWISHGSASATASVVQDRLLVGSARIVAEQLHDEDGVFQQPIPPAALELFDSSDIDRIYYRVTSESGQMVTGYGELALPSRKLQPETPLFFDSVVRDERVRVVAFLQRVMTDSGVKTAIVEIAQTMHGHEQLTTGLWLQAMVKQFVLLGLAAILILFGLRHGLQPLIRLRQAVLTREPGTELALETRVVPTELVSLVAAFNGYARRLDAHTVAQRTFIQNAAHQLRTPLTVLTTQVSYASRTADAISREESLTAIRHTVQQSVRLVNQLLTLSAAEAHESGATLMTSVRLDNVVRSVLEDLAAQAQAREIDLGFEMSAEIAVVQGHAVALREITMNLIDNAIRYTDPGGAVTSRIDVSAAAVTLTVEDNGPGIPPEHREHVFERFYRVHDRDSGGCGLGLPIVREFASRMGASVRLGTPEQGRGLIVEVRFIRLDAALEIA